MSNYSQLEKKVARLLSRFPCIKFFIKKTYQRLNSILYKKSYVYTCKYRINKLSFCGEESFFGYYDKSPINLSGRYIVFHSVSFSTKKMPEEKKGISIVLYDRTTKKYKRIDTSLAYNWQQGSKLMWINDKEFIYNHFDVSRNIYTSKIYNVVNEKHRVIDFPIYDATDTFAISLNFERLNIKRGDYAYRNMNMNIDWSENKSDGLFYVDLLENSSKLIMPLSKIIQYNYKESMENALHKFNHIMISPNKKKMMFMHRWYLPNGRKFDSLYVSNVDGSNLKLIADDEMVSHCCWKSDNEIIAYLRDRALGDKFYLINIEKESKVVIGNGNLDAFGDGHPSFYDNKLLFDTYPNKSRMKELLLYDMQTDILSCLGEFYESMQYYGETRCDLHPRYVQNGKMIFIDSVHEARRHLYQIEL